MSTIVDKTKSIISCDDFELNIKRENKVSYKYSYPVSKKLNGIVFVIPGFGQDANDSYLDKLRTFIAENFSVLAVNVFYHCYYSRPENGAELSFDEFDMHLVKDLMLRYDIKIDDIEKKDDETIINIINSKIDELKKDGVVDKDFNIMLPMTILPKNNEYQNFGVLQAIDHLNVLSDIESDNFNFNKDYTVTVLGSSHGGYIAHLIAKFAPAKIDYVIDNSSYIKAPLHYVIGKEINILNPEYKFKYENIDFYCFVKTLWTNNSKKDNYFSSDRRKIRDLSDKSHIE